MPSMTKVGPPTSDDSPKRNSLMNRIWRGSRAVWFWNSLRSPWGLLIWWRTTDVEIRAEPKPIEQPWVGIPEAELTDDQEDEAQLRLAGEWRHREE